MSPPTAVRQSRAILWIASTLVLTGLTGLFGPGARAQSGAGRQEPVTLNFVNADIEAVARTMGAMTGTPVVVDPRIKGTVTLINDKPVSRATALAQFQAALRLQGYTLIDAGNLLKVLPEADAKLQSPGVTVSEAGAASAPGNQVTTQIFRLNFESASNLVAVLRPLISANNTINVNPGNNSLVITDYADNLRRIGRIIAAMDVANATEVEVLPLQHAIAADLAPLVLRLIESSTGAAPAAAGAADASFRTVLVAEPRSNSLILRAANPARVALVKSLVAKLDRPDAPGSDPSGNIRVVYLRNADATRLAATLRAALSGEARPPTGASASPSTAGAQASPAAGTTGGQVQADVATNSLIITAPEPQYRQLRAVIDRLDARRAQVFVESLIAEVSADQAAEFGIQWQGALGSAGSPNIGLLGTNFGAGISNIINLSASAAAGTPSVARGANLGIAHQTNGVYVLGFLARFLEETGNGNVLSTPNLLTLDNEEARIVIGQNVPFVTGQFTNTGSSNTVNPFQTIERKDVGLTLKVKPQISESGTVKLTIYQEVSSVDPTTKASATGPTTNKRSIESNVVVDDGSVIVLGGLLSEEFSNNKDQVPG
ncbi:MAG: type II secretion system protein GspD, partial [Rhodoferax sp.]|nr:type II secretion system protein GspD [Rhodoferax sp.]